jgi:hypothetical protein
MVIRGMHITASGSYTVVGNFELLASVARELIKNSIHRIVNDLLIKRLLACL